MSGKQEFIGPIAEKLCRDYPNSPTMTLAKKLYKEHKQHFKTLESARSLVRRYRGEAMGGTKLSPERITPQATPKTLNPFNLPESFADSFESYVVSQKKNAIISDLHFPYQDNAAIEVCLKYIKNRGADAIILNGDTMDFASISRHEKDWRQRRVHEEFNAVRQFLTSLRKNFPNSRIIFKDGNHDERWPKWLFVKAPELFDDPEYRLDVRLKFGELDIEYVTDKRPIEVGKLTVLHGHELTGGSGGVNPARSAFLKTLSSVLIGHYHKTSQHTETTLTGDVISVNSTGALCGLHPNYMPINKWNHGFAYVEHDIKSGDYQLDNLKIIKGKVF